MNEFIKDLTSSDTIGVLEESLNRTLPDDEAQFLPALKAGQSEFHSRRKTNKH